MTNQQTIFLKTEINKLDISEPLLSLNRVTSPKSHQNCVICGIQADNGLKLHFYHDQNNVVWATTKGTPQQQGYQGILHGGFIAALLDAAMCHAVFNQGSQGVTADINIRYLNEIPLGAELIIRSKITKSNSTLFKLEAQIYVDQQLMVQSTARFIKRPEETR